jgi:hypothetical protein
VGSFDVDPGQLEGDDRANYVMWNVLAATDELHEALANVGWKPWATDRSIDREMLARELVDVLHFVGNLLLVSGVDPEELWSMYANKVRVNAERQRSGYTGKEKCSVCGNALDDSGCTGNWCSRGGDC